MDRVQINNLAKAPFFQQFIEKVDRSFYCLVSFDKIIWWTDKQMILFDNYQPVSVTLLAFLIWNTSSRFGKTLFCESKLNKDRLPPVQCTYFGFPQRGHFKKIFQESFLTCVGTYHRGLSTLTKYCEAMGLHGFFWHSNVLSFITFCIK